jgi:hypothetical protein
MDLRLEERNVGATKACSVSTPIAGSPRKQNDGAGAHDEGRGVPECARIRRGTSPRCAIEGHGDRALTRAAAPREPAFKGGLVDECHLLICPVIIGGGKPALPRDVRAELELVDERRFTDGVVYLRYRKPV